MRVQILAAFLLSCLTLSAADFQDFQAARAVIGQASFSAHDPGVTAVALSLAKGSLYVADASGQLLSYDLSLIGAGPSTTCPVCLVTPRSKTAQNVFEGIAAVAVNGGKIVIADAKSHSVMVWSGASSLEQPNIVLSGFANPTSVALDNHRLFVGDAGSHHVFIWNTLPTTGSQPPDITLGVSDNYDSPGPDTIQTPAALASDGGNLYVADSAAHRVLVFSPGDMGSPRIVNAATLTAGPLAPGTLVSISSNTKSTVLLNGSALRVTDTTGDQIQVQIPFDLGNSLSGSLWTQSVLDDGAASVSRPVAVHFTTNSPGIFAFGAKEPRTGLLLHTAGAIPLSPEDPAKPSEVLTVWATGLGLVTAEANSDGSFGVLAPLRAILNGVDVEVLSATLPADATGIYEVRLRLPAELSDSANLMLIQNDVKSNVVTFPVGTKL
jgi:uncharacterized protein (TIGR03437 family)